MAVRDVNATKTTQTAVTNNNDNNYNEDFWHPSGPWSEK